MQLIFAPITPGSSGPQVLNLIEALFALINGGVFKSSDPRDHVSAEDLKKLGVALEDERAKQYFGPAVTELVRHFQIQQGLADKPDAVVDGKTASRMNDVLLAIGVKIEDLLLEVSGLVYDHLGRRLVGLEVRVFDRDVQRETQLGSALTDEAGAYHLTYPESLYRKTPAERGGPELIARAFDAQGLLLGESDLLSNAATNSQLDVVIRQNLLLVSGTVRDERGRALRSLTVRAFDRDLRSEEPLGSALTDAQGAYQIPYVIEQFRRAEKSRADLVLRVFGPGTEGALFSTPVQFNAPARAVIDIVMPAAALEHRPEWERYGLALAPLLGKVPPRELTDEDLEFLVAETGFPLAHLRLMRLDAQWRAQFPHHKLAASIYYGLLRQGFAEQLSLVLRAGATHWREALKQAIADRQIQTGLGAVLDEQLKVLAAIAADAAFVAPGPDAPEDAAPGIGVLLAGSDVAPDVQRQIAAAMTQLDANADEATWSKALDEAGVSPAGVDSARFAIQSITLLGGHLPTLAQLQRTDAQGFARGSDLAALSRGQWLKVAQALDAQGMLPVKDMDATAYATQLADGIEAAYPTRVYAHQLTNDNHFPRRAVAQFLLQNPTFDLMSTPIGRFMKGANLDGINLPAATLAEELGKEVRVARLTAPGDRVKQADQLLALGMHSAVHVAALGRKQFVSLMSGKLADAEARLIHINAKLRTDELVLNAMRTRDLLDYPITAVAGATTESGSELATWAGMFGNQNGCYCPPCESAHGPAAYLVDLIEFLKDKDADLSPGGPALREIFFARRPDLQFLALNCANAMTPLPYIDLVIELLESLLVGAWQPGDVLQTPDNGDAADIAARLRALPQTRNLEELRAETHNTLAEAGYPWSWPFDTEFARAAVSFNLVGVTPAEVLAFGVSDATERARVRLGLTAAQWGILQGSYTDDATQVAVAWGVPIANELGALTTIGTPSGLLARSGLGVDDLFGVLESPLFAGWAVAIDRSADPCNIDVAYLGQQSLTHPDTIVPLDDSALVEVFDLLHRVLRLRLAIGWPLLDLTIALQALGVGRDARAIDLVQLATLADVATRAEVTVQRIAALTMQVAGARDGWLALLGVTSADYDDLVALGLPDPVAATTVAEQLPRAVAALETIDLLRRAGIEAAELRYLLTSVDRVPGLYAPRAGEHIRLLDDLEGDIEAATVDLEPDPTTPADQQARERRRRRVGAIVERLAAITGTSFVVDVIAADLKVVDPSVARPALLRSTSGVAGGVVEDFIAAAESEDAIPDAANSLWRVTKTCRLLGLLGMTAADVRSLSQLPALFDFNLLPPARGGAAPALTIDSVRPLIEASLTQRALPAQDTRLLDVLAHSSTDVAASRLLESLTGWGHALRVGSDAPESNGAAVLRGLAGLLGLVPDSDVPDADLLTPWQSPALYARLLEVVQWMLARRLTAGVERSDLATLRAAALDPAAGLEALEMLAHGRFADDRAYYEAVAPAMDRLRIGHRDALLAQLLHVGAGDLRFATADDVYAHLLIDVQMGPCQLTSRIVQAHSAVQLFVQRCLMNLEQGAGVSLGDVSDIVEWREWEWMKNYRVWEAARKVFLWPENWIEPELRDHKSPFFEELENELLQDAITDESAERALTGYLRKLHEVGRLDIRAMFDERISGVSATGAAETRSVLHVVARTRAVPHAHFYRQRDEVGVWGPWEKIEQGVTGDHLLLTAYNRKVTLLWATFKEVQSGVVNGALEQPTLLAITLHWMTKSLGTWSATRHGDLQGLIAPAYRDGWSMRMARNDVQGLDIVDYVQGGGDWPALYPRGAPGAVYRIDPCTGELNLIPPRSHAVPVRTEPLPWRAVASENRLLENPDSNASALTVRTSRTASPDLDTPMQGFTVVTGSPDLYFFAHESRQFLATRFMVLQAQIDGRLLEQDFGIDSPVIPDIFHRRSPSTETRWESKEVLHFQNHYHPYVCTMLERVQFAGAKGLYRAAEPAGYHAEYTGAIPREFPRQLMHERTNTFVTRYHPHELLGAYPFEQFEFAFDAAYSLYNWELFFHVPMLLADRLSKEGSYSEAQKWLHCVFDPTDVSSHNTPAKYWRVRPLLEEADRWRGPAQTIEEMMRRLAQGAPDLEAQVAAWRADPFNPHLLARLRLVAYMKSVVRKYVENLIAWGDSLFRRDTIEALNEATQLYVLASGVLGPVPVIMPPMTRPVRCYDDLSAPGFIDEFANALVPLESSITGGTGAPPAGARAAPRLPMLYFCIPSNARLQELRELVADRLFKLRHCMDIDGRSRQLALFAPPIDPALLVRARAAGLDLGAVINLPTGARRNYRFSALLQKAHEFAGELRGFGAALLSALEKRDGEQLAQLRTRHETGLLERAADIRRQQLEEAVANLEGARRSRLQAQARVDFYASRQFMSATEQNQVSNMQAAHALETVGQEFKLLASILHIIPDFKAGMDVGATFGGRNLGDAMGAVGDLFGFIASQSSFQASMSSLLGGHERRKEDWDFQADLARKDVAQLEQQIVAAEIRVAIAEREQRNHDAQIAQAEEAEAFLRDKFTSTQLYSWMSAQLSALHYQSYRMALDLACQAEAAARQELQMGPGELRAIGSDHWDGGRKGLLAGDRLAQELRRLELDHLNANKRRFELTSHLSLRRVDAIALMNLRVGGFCRFTLTPGVLALDFPGQIGRRVKSIAVSIPGVVGPYVGVHGRLRVTDEDRASATIVTSSGQNDAGVFALDFRDERYLPFEGLTLDGDTTWELTLPATRAFDYGTISDVILHVQYTSREDAASAGGPRWSADAASPGAPRWSGSGTGGRRYQLLDVRADFPNAWRQLRETGVSQEVRLGDELFPYLTGGAVHVLHVSGPPGREAVRFADREVTLIAADAADGAAERAAGFGYLIVEYEVR